MPYAVQCGTGAATRTRMREHSPLRLIYVREAVDVARCYDGLPVLSDGDALVERFKDFEEARPRLGAMSGSRGCRDIETESRCERVRFVETTPRCP